MTQRHFDALFLLIHRQRSDKDEDAS